MSFQAASNYQHVRGLSYLNSSNAFTTLGILTTPSNPANPGQDIGPGDFSQPHRFTLTAVYNTRFGIDQPALSMLANGWTLTSRVAAQSGLPFNTATSAETAPAGRNEAGRAAA